MVVDFVGGVIVVVFVVQVLKLLDIFYGMQIGMVEDLVQQVVVFVCSCGFQFWIKELDVIDMFWLVGMEWVIIVILIYGEGEMFDNVYQFWDVLLGFDVFWLEWLFFGVLVFGDMGYEYFCQVGKLIDMWLEQFGVQWLGVWVDCDVDFEDVVVVWLFSVLFVDSGMVFVVVLDVVVVFVVSKIGFGCKNFYVVWLVQNCLLFGVNFVKEIWYFVFDLGDSGLSYEVGDVFGVLLVNNFVLVQVLLVWFGVLLDLVIFGQDVGFLDLLIYCFEICILSCDLIVEIGKCVGYEELFYVLVNGDKEVLDVFLWGCDMLDLLNFVFGLKLDVVEFLGWFKFLQYWVYLILFSLKVYFGEVYLIVVVVCWMVGDRVYGGVCLIFLVDQQGGSSLVFMLFNKSFCVLQDGSVLMIMVGFGIGIVLFCVFFEEWCSLGVMGMNWLFFGDQYCVSDFIYEDEIGQMSVSGFLIWFDLVFLCDQVDKIYVQNCMEENGCVLFVVLEEGGYFYVCGDVMCMVCDVDVSLYCIIEIQGGLIFEVVIEYVNCL